MRRMMLKCFLVALIATSCASKFCVEDLGKDKFTELRVIKGVNNWVRSDGGKYSKDIRYVAFDFVTQSKEEGELKDRFLVLKVDNSLYINVGSYFHIGEHLILTLNGSEKIRLKPEVVAFGKFSKLQGASEEDRVIYLSEELFQQIINADQIAFELEGKRILSIEELSGKVRSHVIPMEVNGCFSLQNLENLKSLRLY